MKCMNCGKEFPDVVSAMDHCIGCEGETDLVLADMLVIHKFKNGESVFHGGKDLTHKSDLDVVQRHEHPDEVIFEIAFTDARKAAGLIASDYSREFGPAPREEKQEPDGSCQPVLPPERFKVWLEYPLDEFPCEAETDAIRNVFVDAVYDLCKQRGGLCNKGYLCDVFHVLQREFFWAVLARDRSKRTGLSCRMLAILEDALFGVMTHQTVTAMAKESNLPFGRVYDYMCAMQLWLAEHTDTPEMARFRVARTDAKKQTASAEAARQET